MDRDQEQFCLNWKTFPDHVASTFRDLITEGHFTDVTLVSDDQIPIPAHKIVLSASSPVLKTLLLNHPHSHPLIYLRGVKHQQLNSILQFMYCGEADIYQNHFNDFLKIATDLEVKEISKEAVYKKAIVSSTKEDLGEENNSSISSQEALTSEMLGIISEDMQSNISEQNESSNGTSAVTQCFECQICESVFSSKSNLQKHSRSKHEGVKYPCNLCEYKATQQWSLRQHKQFKHEGLKYFCKQCEYQATTKSRLRQHKQFVHEGLAYSCNQCAYSATSQSELNKHVQYVHEGLTYLCSQCEYKATTQGNLRAHQQAKHEGMAYFCNQCEYQTGWQQQLVRHEALKHSSSMSFKSNLD